MGGAPIRTYTFGVSSVEWVSDDQHVDATSANIYGYPDDYASPSTDDIIATNVALRTALPDDADSYTSHYSAE